MTDTVGNAASSGSKRSHADCGEDGISQEEEENGIDLALGTTVTNFDSDDDDSCSPEDTDVRDDDDDDDDDDGACGGAAADTSADADAIGDELSDPVDQLCGGDDGDDEDDTNDASLSDAANDADDDGDVEDTDRSGGGEDGSRPKKKKKKAEKNYCKVDGEWVCISFDVENTGSVPQHDRIIEIGCVAYRKDGKVLSTFERRIGTDVKIMDKAREIHGISDGDIRGLPQFDTVGPELLKWMDDAVKMATNAAGILVAHNGDNIDFRFLFCELMRHNLALPASIKYTCDTYAKLGKSWSARFSSLDYFSASHEEWPGRQEKNPDRPRMKVSDIVSYLLKKPSRISLCGGPVAILADLNATLTFESVCGPPHKAIADAIAAAIVHSDKEGIAKAGNKPGSKGIYRTVKDVWAEAKEIYAKPPLVHTPVDSPFVELKKGDSMPAGGVGEPEFQPEATPGPTAHFWSQVGFTPEQISTMDVRAIMLKVFFYFFSFWLLDFVVDCTNNYATSPKVTVTDSSGKKIKRTPDPTPSPTHTHHNTHSWAIMPSTRSTTDLRVEACKHMLQIAGIEPDSELVTVLETNGVLQAGLAFLMRADKTTLAKMTVTVKEQSGSDQTTIQTANPQQP